MKGVAGLREIGVVGMTKIANITAEKRSARPPAHTSHPHPPVCACMCVYVCGLQVDFLEARDAWLADTAGRAGAAGDLQQAIAGGSSACNPYQVYILVRGVFFCLFQFPTLFLLFLLRPPRFSCIVTVFLVIFSFFSAPPPPPLFCCISLMLCSTPIPVFLVFMS